MRDTTQFLNAIGHNDRVFIRCLAPKHTPIAVLRERAMAYEKDGNWIASVESGWLNLADGTFEAIRGKRLSKIKDGWGLLDKFNQKGYGIYFVVNHGGVKNSEIALGTTLFHESDRVSLEEQQKTIDRITQKFGEPTATIQTRKSIHSYWASSDAIEVSRWVELQRRWLQYSDCDDSSLSDPAQIMRLPGFDHVAWNPEKQDFDRVPCRLLSLSEARYTIDKLDRELPPLDLNRWIKANCKEIVNGEASPLDIRSFAPYLEGYNASGRKGWITAKCPAHDGESFDSLHVDINSGGFICHAGCGASEVYNQAKALAVSSGYRLPVERSPELEDLNLEELLSAARSRLNPHDVLPSHIADKITQISKARGTNPEGLILSLLVASSGVSATHTRLSVANWGDRLTVYPNLSGMLVGDSGSLKSPTMRSGFTSLLRKIQDGYTNTFKSEEIDHKREMRQWEAADKRDRGDEPEKPRQRIVMIKDGTIEKIEDIALNQPEFSPCIYRDELIGLFQSFDKYGGKNGNDANSKLLSYYDGDRVDKHRVGSGSQISTHDFHPAIFGGIQPEVLKKLASNIGYDSDGTLCRFLYAPNIRTYKEWDINPDSDAIDVGCLERLVANIHKLPARECTLDRAGQSAWAKVANYYNQQVCNNERISAWLKHTYSKAVGQLGKIALTLHLIENADKGSAIPGIISVSTIERAAIALDYFITQAKNLIAETEETLEAHLVKILTKARKLGSIAARQVQQNLTNRNNKVSSEEAKQYLNQLVELGYGSLDSKFVFTPIPESSYVGTRQTSANVEDSSPPPPPPSPIPDPPPSPPPSPPPIEPQPNPESIAVGNCLPRANSDLSAPPAIVNAPSPSPNPASPVDTVDNDDIYYDF